MKVLVADDDLHLRQGLIRLLEQEGYECLGVSNGQDALLALSAFSPELCLFDVMMPDLTGIELCSAMRNRGFFQPVFLLTAFDEQVDKIDGFRQGADDYLTKPFNPDELLARIGALARRECYKSQVTSLTLQNEDFILAEFKVCVAQMKLCYKGREVIISRRELAFLQLLKASNQDVLTKDQILDVCWGRAYLPNSRVLDQFIAVLRKKVLKALQAPDLLETVYGVGYKLSVDTRQA